MPKSNSEKKKKERFASSLYADNDMLRMRFIRNKFKDASKDIFSTLKENSKFPLLIFQEVNEGFKMVDLSDQITEILGYTRSDIVSGVCNPIIENISDYDDDDDFIDKKFKNEKERKRLKKLILKKSDGTKLSFIVTVSIITANNSKFYVCYLNYDNTVGDIQDISSEANSYAPYIDKIIEACVDGIVITDARGYISVINSATEKIFGYTREEMSEKKPMDFIPGEEKYFVEGAKMVEQLMTNGVVSPWESAIINKSTEIVPVEWTMSYFYDDAGNIAGSIGVCRDLRERKMLEYQVLQSNKLAALGQLAAGIAHEINNPLAGIVGYSQYLIKKMNEKNEEGLSPEEMPLFIERLGKIEHEAQKSKHIIQNLLKFSRGNDVFKMDTVDLNQILNDTIDVIGSNVLLNNIQVEKSMKEEICKIRGNSFQLEQVFTNFIINACQAMPEGGVLTLMTGNVTSKNDKTEYVYVVIADTGEGIEKGYLTKIFDPFFTTKRPGAGTGLGLSVSYGIIRQHEGEIEVSSETDCGTCFFIYFPTIQE